MHEWSRLRYFRCKSQDHPRSLYPNGTSPRWTRCYASWVPDSEELDAPTDGPTAGIHTHVVVPKTSEAEEFEEEEEEEEEEEDRKQYPHTPP